MSTKYEKESISSIRDRVLKTLGTVDLPYSFRGMLGSSLSGLSYMLHGHLDFLARNMIPDEAEGDVLDRWAIFFGVSRRPEVKHIVIIEVLGLKGAQVPSSWVVSSEDFTAEKEVFLDDSGKGQLTCFGEKEPALFASLEIATLKTTSSEVQTEAKIVGRTTRIPKESDDSLRSRLIQAAQATTQGGSPRDYVLWTKSIPGVREVFVKPWHLVEGGKPGHVWVTWLEDKLEQSESVRLEIEKLMVQVAPASACVSVKTLVVKELELVLRVSPNTKECREAVEIAVKEFFYATSKPSGYLNEILEKTTSCISLSQLSAAISAVPMEKSHTIENLEKNLEIKEGEILKCKMKFL